jgi:acyl carrier protein
VMAYESRSQESSLVAYFVSRSRAPSERMLRLFLRESLPEYMVPSGYVQVDALPMMPSGKIDRTTLHMRGATLRNKNRFAAPESRVERVVTQIIAGLLGEDVIDLERSFIEMGGDSLLAMRVVNQVQERLETALPMTTILEAGTIRELCATLESAGGRNSRDRMGPV